MPKLVTPLNNLQIKNAQPKDKAYKLADGGGMYLLVNPDGSKYWRMDYRLNDKRNTLAFGKYPEVPLIDAKKYRQEAREMIAKGVDPAQAKRIEKATASSVAANTFEAVAREWHQNRAGHAWQPQTAKQNLIALEKDLFPLIGKLPIATIKTPLMLDVLQQVEKRGALEVTRRVASLASSVFEYAIVKGLSEYDPIPALKSALRPREKGHHAAILVADLPEFLSALVKNESRMYLPNKIGLRLMMLTFVRTSELIETPWSEIDLENERWVIPWNRMKMGKKKLSPRKVDHHVFLPAQGWALLRELHQYTGGNQFLFPNRRDHEKPISNGMILQALKRMGYGGKHTGHGFRSLAKGILKTLKYPISEIERQLSHASGEAYGGAYDREDFFDERKKMMQHYANYLQSIERGNILIGNSGVKVA